MISYPALFHAAWITAAVAAVCLALCTIHSRRPYSSSSGRRDASSRCASARGMAPRTPPREGSGGGAAAGATPAAKVSPTPSNVTAKASCVGELQALSLPQAPVGGDDVAMQDGAASPVTVIDVGSHGPIAPVFPVLDPQPPRRSLSVKHIRFAVARIRSRRWGGDDDDEAHGDEPDDSTLWTKTILLGERCRVPTGDENDGDTGDAMVRWKSYRPRQPRSVPVTRSNSFAGEDNRAGSCRPAALPGTCSMSSAGVFVECILSGTR